VPVDVDVNKQLKYYALGALLSNKLWVAKTVKITIVQPRCDHEQGRIRSYTFPAVELVDFAGDVVMAAKRTEEFGADLVPSKKACRFCPANAANKCPAIEKETNAVVAASFDMLEPGKYSLAQIAEFLAKAPLVEARISALREFAYQRACAGEKIPGFKLVDKRAIRKWKDDELAAKKLKRFKDVDQRDLYKSDLKSPAQIEKLVGKKQFAQLSDLVAKESSGHTLVFETDNRPSVEVAQLEHFDIIEE
jgi:ribonuclease BN (tRNA processing enzyme)